MIKSRHALLALVLALPASQLQAQEQVITSLNVLTMRDAVVALGGEVGQATVQNGRSFYAVRMGNGVPAVASLDRCQGQECTAMTIVATLPMPQNKTAAEVDEALRNLNNSLPAAKAFRVGQSIVVQDYIITDYGISTRNLQLQLRVFSEVAQRVFQLFNP